MRQGGNRMHFQHSILVQIVSVYPKGTLKEMAIIGGMESRRIEL